MERARAYIPVCGLHIGGFTHSETLSRRDGLSENGSVGSVASSRKIQQVVFSLIEQPSIASNTLVKAPNQHRPETTRFSLALMKLLFLQFGGESLNTELDERRDIRTV